MGLLNAAPMLATVGPGNLYSVAISGVPLTMVRPGAIIWFGSYGKGVDGPYVVDTVTPSGTSGGTLTLRAPVGAALTNQPCLIELGFNGDQTSFQNFVLTSTIAYLYSVLGLGTTLGSSSRVLDLNKASSAALSQLLFRLADTACFSLEQRNVGGVEMLCLRATADGTTWVDALQVNRVDGGVTASGRLVAASVWSDSLYLNPTGSVLGTPSSCFTAGGLSVPNYGIALGKGTLPNAPGVHISGFGGIGFYSVSTMRWLLDDSAILRPASDNVYQLGSPSYRISTIFAGTGSINTSDAAEKTPLRAFTDAELDAWGEVGSGVYQYQDAVAEKGTGHARLHAGYTAQAVESAFRNHGIDPARMAVWCADTRTAPVETTRTVDRPTAEGGTERVTETVLVDTPTGETRYGLRYDQCATIEAAYQRRRADRIEARLAALETRLAQSA